MKRSFYGVCFATMLVIAAPLSVQAQEKGADDLAVEGLSKLLSALSVFIDSIPQYETPELLENGDIIIRRKNKDKKLDDDKEIDNGMEKTST